MIRGLGNLYKSVNCNFMLKVVIFTSIIQQWSCSVIRITQQKLLSYLILTLFGDKNIFTVKKVFGRVIIFDFEIARQLQSRNIIFFNTINYTFIFSPYTLSFLSIFLSEKINTVECQTSHDSNFTSVLAAEIYFSL